MTTAIRILIIILLQTLVLFSMIAIRQWTLSTGTLVTLETAPIDPRSLFAGDYVTLGYKINEITANKAVLEQLKAHETVYVVLEPKGQYWVAESVQATKPEVAQPKVAIKGRLEYKADDKIFVQYGIENYFIPEGEGKKLERPKNGEVMTVKVAVDRFGNAAIAGVYVNDKEIYQEKLF